MSLRHLSRQVAPLLRLLTGSQPSAQGIAHVYARAESTAASGGQEQLFGGETLLEIRHRVFGDHIGNGLSSGRKLLRSKLVGERIASYYGTEGERGLERADPFFVDLGAEAKKVKLDKLKRRGKAPPKKGEGKRGKRK